MKCRLMACGLLLVSSMVVGAQELINPSFEDQGEQADLAKGWARWGDWMNREDSWSPVKDGKCLMTYHHWQIEKGDNSGVWQDAAVTPGRKYEFSIFANADRATEEAKDAETVELRLESTVNGEQSTVISRSFKLADIAAGDQWSQLTIEGVAPNGSLRLLVVVYPAKESPRGGALKFDMASLTAK